MEKVISYLCVNHVSARLSAALQRLETSIAKYQLDGLRYPCGPALVPIGDLLLQAREGCSGSAFVWCNSDVELTRNPFDVPDPACVYGFHRTEIPSGKIARGVDMHYIPTKIWDELLSKDIPKLLLGASYVDRWIPCCMVKRGLYHNLSGYISHASHPRSPAACKDADPYYQHNFRAFNSWARRHGIERIPAPPYLIPRIGHVWGIRDALRRLMWKLRKS